MPAPRRVCENCEGVNAVPAEVVAGGCMVVGHVLLCPDCGEIYLDSAEHPDGSNTEVMDEIIAKADLAYDRE